MKRNLTLLATSSVFAFAAVFSGCRFGNYKEEPKQEYQIEYLKAEISYFKTAVEFGWPDDLVVNNSVSTENIPKSVTSRFTNPVALAIPQDKTKNPTLFFNPLDVNLNQQTLLNSDNSTIQAFAESEVSQLWKNEKCLTQVVLSQEGVVQRGNFGSHTFESGESISLTGKLSLDLMYTRYIEGDCEQDLVELAECYSNPESCDATTQSASRVLYDLYVNASGVLDLSQAARIKKLVYLVHFE